MSSGATPKATPFDAAVAEVQAKIEELKTTLATLLRLQAEQGGAPTSTAALRGGDTEISHDTFFNMTIGEAAKKYLSMVKTTKSTAEIAEALERGGLKHSSKNFPSNVRSIIGQREDFTRVPNGEWGLTEWYPGIGRGKKPKAAKAKKKRAAKPKAMKPKVKTPSEVPQGAATTRKAKILNVVRTAPEKYWTAKEVADILKDAVTSVQATMSVMRASGELEKGERGYRLSKAKAA
jgi:hypothetical protein